jgi:hypothetical protein
MLHRQRRIFLTDINMTTQEYLDSLNGLVDATVGRSDLLMAEIIKQNQMLEELQSILNSMYE